jgi:polar amino acid transport system substrate-binding protein
MKRRWFAGGLLAAAVLLAALLVATHRSSSGTNGASSRPLVYAADAEGGAPYVFKNPQNPEQYLGFEVDLAAALAEEIGRPIEFRQYEFSSIFSGLERGDFDFAMNGLEITPDRKKSVRFSRPYYVYRLQFVTRVDETRFQTLAECQGQPGLVIGTLEDTAASRLLDRLGIPKKIYPGQVEPYGDLALGRIDGVLLDLPIALYYARNNPRLKFAGEPIEPGYYAIAFDPRNESLAHEMDGALDRLMHRGILESIEKKWNLWNKDQEALARDETTEVPEASLGAWAFRRYFPLLLQGAATTVLITVLSMALAIGLGLPLALARLYGPAPLRWLGLVYVEFFRGIPVLLLLYFLYYGLPVVAEHLQLGVSLSLAPLQAAVLGLGINYAAYEAEIYRAGISSLPTGQWEAAASLGMSPALTFRRIILPQAIRIILPPMTNDFVGLFKDTSIVSIIAVVELSKQYQILSKTSMKYLEIGLVTAALYLLMSVPLGYLARYLEKRLSAAAGG